QIVKQFPHSSIHVGDTPVVRGVRKPAAERFGWIVGIVRVPQVKPQKKRTALLLAEPFEYVSQGHLAASLHGSLAALPGLLPVKACVVDIEAALESGGKPVFWVEDDAADEGPRVVALGMESSGEKGDAWRQAIAEVADAVVLGISPGEYGRVRDRRNGRLRVGGLGRA